MLQAQDPSTLHQQEAMNGIHFLISLSSDERSAVRNSFSLFEIAFFNYLSIF